MNVAFQRNIGSFLHALPALAAQTITAGAAGDGAAQDGLTIDRNVLTEVVLSGLAVVHVEAALGAADTAEISIAVQDSADGSTWAAYETGPLDDYVAGTIAANDDGHHIFTRKIQLGGARRYVRIQVTATLSAAATDTVKLDGVLIVGGSDELPMTLAEGSGS